jgi:putative ABC transport system permease protein
MGALADAWRRLRSLGRRREFEDRLDDEIRFHVEQQIEKNRRAGMTPDEARRQALIRFGGVEQVREVTRYEFRAVPIEHLVRDVRYGLRSLLRHPAFSAMAVLSLAIGIGANAAIFGVVQTTLFRVSPLAQPETLVNIYETEGGRGFNPMSHPNIEDLRKGTTQVFNGIAASTFFPVPIDGGGTARIVMGEVVTGGAFALLGVEPLFGRAILPEDDIARGGHPVVMLSYGYWQRAFGADPDVVGRTLRLGGRGYTIIGVAPADYRGVPTPDAGLLRSDGHGERVDGRRYAQSAQLPQLLRQSETRTRRDASAGGAHSLPRGRKSDARAARRVGPRRAFLSCVDL